MLFFQKDSKHIFDRFQERFPEIFEKDPAWLAKVVAEINLYLPDDWRLTRNTHNFRIQVMGKNMPALMGHSLRLKDGRILHRINSVFKQNFADEDARNPNLYFYYPRPEDSVTPLYARQYEKVKTGPDGQEMRDEYHRIHPLTKVGLDLEHFRWIHWDPDKEIARDVNLVDPEYHGRDYWIVPPLSDPSGKRLGEFIRNYHKLLDQFEVVLMPPERAPYPHEIEYKFLLPPVQREARRIFGGIREILPDLGFQVKGESPVGQIQEDIYFDDEALHLYQTKVSFRLRRKEDQTRITLKKRVPPASGVGYSPEGLYERLEEEVTITPLQEDALMHEEPINAFPYRLVKYIAPGCGSLKPLLALKNKRKLLPLVDKNGRELELCFDRVTYLIDDEEVGPYFEVELESKGAPRQDIARVADLIEEQFGLIPSRQTKYERGISLLKIRQQPSGKKLVIIDTDCGVDDALALILALKSPELEVKAITTVAGNVPVEKVIPNVFRVLEALGLSPDKNPLVAKGAERPLARDPIVAKSVHGNDGLGDAALPNPEIRLDSREAWEVICDLAKKYPKKITLITIGPMTNLALAIQNDPAGVRCLKEVVAMGGVFFEVGNVGPDAEFNVGADPEAAWDVVQFCRDSCFKIPVDENWQEVSLPPEPTKEDYERIKAYKEHDPNDPDMVPLTFVGLDVSHKVILRRAALERAVTAHPDKQLLRFIQAISGKYMDFYHDNEWLPGCYLHDPLAIAYVINPSFLEIKKYILKVETGGRFTSGMIFPDDRPTRNPAWRNPAEEVIGVARRVEKEAFEDFFLERLIHG